MDLCLQIIHRTYPQAVHINGIEFWERKDIFVTVLILIHSSFNLTKANAQNRGTLSVISNNVSRHESTVYFDFQYCLSATVENCIITYFN